MRNDKKIFYIKCTVLIILLIPTAFMTSCFFGGTESYEKLWFSISIKVWISLILFMIVDSSIRYATFKTRLVKRMKEFEKLLIKEALK